jgi:methylenetetrahydrofolate--tRNA-(uracil-5-)-methyltransferase
MNRVHIVGGGLAGSEAAYQIAKRGYSVVLHEMRPVVASPAHHTEQLAELVCSNSLKSNQRENAAGLLKEEMRELDSLIISVADQTRVPAGQALAVDREAFSKQITKKISEMSNITILREEVTEIPDSRQDLWIVASGPLTSAKLLESLQRKLGEPYLHFFDAAAPLVTVDSLDMSKIYRASRYDKGDADYLNCPFQKHEYEIFWQSLIEAEQSPLHEFEKGSFFEGCIPVEELARRGKETLAFGPLKPIGLRDPITGITPYAVMQLRQDNVAGNLYGLVGFQTNLKFSEQKRVFSLIPGLKNAEFVRYGVMHRNAFINSPKLLKPTMQLKENDAVFFAGQLSGVEGYIESAATGLICGINCARILDNQDTIIPPKETMLGSLMHYITHADEKSFQPMNAVFGIVPPLEKPIRNKQQRYQAYSIRALESIRAWKDCLE